MIRRFKLGHGTLLLIILPLISIPLPAQAEPTPVRVEPVMKLAIYPQLSAPAQVLSLNDSRLEASIIALVEQIPVRVGDVVLAGDKLLSLECGDQRNTLEQGMAGRDALRARLTFAEFQYTRARSLKSSNSLSDEALRQRKADAAALQAELSGAEAGGGAGTA